jgi:light-regulated signal transduction histidine kinase (bacteriophytochrome)
MTANKQLGSVNAKLSESNENLQQFAYVASHDLQEPLRMISSYVQLLAKRYKGQLDSDADEFMGFAIDGARRMQRLISDLLEFSRVGTRAKPFERVDMNAVIERVLQTLKLSIEDHKATVTRDLLPTVTGDPIQLGQLLQNLIGNALKFCKERPPAIHVSAMTQGHEWVVSVRDNGIGIDPKYFDRIFAIFQRLHTREEYDGTGIGLAVCKKIALRHGGRIWVESQVGQGSTFFFSIAGQKEGEET